MKKKPKKTLSKVALGGTFDRFHEGHRYLLNTAFRFAQKVVIGITTQEMIQNKKNFEKIQSYNQRQDFVVKYIEKTLKCTKENYQIAPLHDPYGPTISDPNIEGLVCSVETYNTALQINELRREKSLKPLILIVIPLVYDSNSDKISSSNLRKKL